MPAPSMLDRRAVLGGISCCLSCAALARPTTAREVQSKVSNLKKIKGCFVESNNAALVQGANLSTGSNSHLPAEVSTMMRSTGDKDLDRSFDRALQRLAETFDVWPKVGFYDDGDAPNALAMRYNVGGTHEFAVVFGRNYFKKQMEYDPSGISLLQTAAHEFAHVWVYKDDLFEAIRGGQPTVKRIEMHADCLAGYYLGIRKRDNPQASFWAAGIGRWQSGDTQFRNMHHHGTPDERLAAAEHGFKLGFLENRTPKQAFASATAYVTDK